MRVLHIITGLGSGGAEQQLRLLLRHLPADCAVATLTNPGVTAAAIQAEGTPVLDIGMRHNRDVPTLATLVRLIRSGGYDLVHTHLYRACVYGRIAARLAGVSHIVATEHSIGDGLVEGRRGSFGVRALYLATERLGDVTIAVSRTVARRLAEWGVPPSRIALIPNGIDATQFRFDPVLRGRTRAALGFGPGDYVVGAMGRLEHTKRLDVLIRAVAQIDGAVLLVVGDGAERARLERLARDRGVASRVTFTGGRRDVRGLLCAMDVLASPSEAETFGLAILEALACGLPVRYVSCPALEELPRDNAPDARRVPSGIEAMRDALQGVALAPALAPARRSRLPPPAVGHYDIHPLAARVAQLYEHVVRDPVIGSGRSRWFLQHKFSRDC